MTDSPSYRPLGYDGPHYYVLSGAKQQMGSYSAGQLMTAAGCLDIVGDVDYWLDYYAVGPKAKPRVDWQRAGSAIMAQCVAAGLFDPSRVRGRGVWLDAGRVVLHGGARMWVGGEPVSPGAIDSDYLYQARPSWMPGLADLPAGVSAILEACTRIPWAHPMSAELLAGWIALAPVCGALSHRPHLRIEGDTAAAMDVARAALGTLVLTGEPGQDARPLITDNWLRSTGACMVLTAGKMPDATVLRTGDGIAQPSEMPADMPQRLLARQVAGLHALRHNIATFRALSGHGDTGTLMAGAWSLYSSDVLAVEIARGFLGRYAMVGE